MPCHEQSSPDAWLGTAARGAKRPFIRKTAFGPIPRQMVFKQTIEEDIVGSTGVKGGSAPPLLPRPAHPVFDLASGQPEIAEHAVVQLGETRPQRGGQPVQLRWLVSRSSQTPIFAQRGVAQSDATAPVAARRCRGFHRAILSSAFPFPFSPVLHCRNDRRSLAMRRRPSLSKKLVYAREFGAALLACL